MGFGGAEVCRDIPLSDLDKKKWNMKKKNCFRKKTPIRHKRNITRKIITSWIYRHNGVYD